MKTFIFVFVMINMQGEVLTESKLVASCPDNEKVEIIFDAAKEAGEISDWGAICVAFQTKGSI